MTPMLRQPDWLETNAIFRPSGDQRGEYSNESSMFAVSSLSSPPVIDSSQISLPLMSSFPRRSDVNANHRPSGEICGSVLLWGPSVKYVISIGPSGILEGMEAI